MLKKNALHLIPFLIIWSFLLSYFAGFFILGFFMIVPLITFISLFFWFQLKNLKPFFTETHVQFDAQYMYLTKNGNTSKWSFIRIEKVLSQEKHWLLYLSKRQYIYVPKNIFYTEADFTKFKISIKA